jgi:HEPN domain-containing protein
MASGYLKDAELSLQEAKNSLTLGSYHRAVRRSQEAVELATKAVLRSLAIEYPRSHEVTSLLADATTNRDLPDWFTKSIPTIRRISLDLAGDRGPAFYGDEDAFKPPERLYDRKAAEDAYNGAAFVVDDCKRLIEERFQSPKASKKTKKL